MTDTNARTKGRALLLAALMVLSVVAGTVAFAGSAAGTSANTTAVTDPGIGGPTPGSTNVVVMNFTLNSSDTVVNNHDGTTDAKAGDTVGKFGSTARFTGSDSSYGTGDEVFLDDDGDGYYTGQTDTVIDTDGTGTTSDYGSTLDANNGDELEDAENVSVAADGNAPTGGNGLYYVDTDSSGGYSSTDVVVLVPNPTSGASLKLDAGLNSDSNDDDNSGNSGEDSILSAGSDNNQNASDGDSLVQFTASDNVAFEDAGTDGSDDGAYQDGEDIVVDNHDGKTVSKQTDTNINAGTDGSWDANDGATSHDLDESTYGYVDVDDSGALTLGDEVYTEGDQATLGTGQIFGDELNDITLENQGNLSDSDINSVTLWRESPTSEDKKLETNDDTNLGSDGATANGQWNITGLTRDIGEDVTDSSEVRFYVTVDIASSASQDDTLNFKVSPLSDSNDNNAYESGDSGAFFAQDAAMGDLSNGDQVVVDTAAQNPTITSPANVQYRQSSGTLNVSYSYQEKHPNAVWIQVDQGSDGGVKNDTYYRIDDSQYADDDTTKSLTIDLDDETGGASLGTGLHEISIHVKDSGGLTSTSGEKQVLYVDDVKPTNTGTFSAVDSSSTTTNVTLNGVSDADSGISLADTTITVTQGSNTWTLHGDDPGVVLKQNGDLVVDTENSSIGSFSEGDVTVDYDIVDKAGNVRKDTGNTFSINTQAPRIDTVEAEAGLSDVTVNFSEPVTAADAGISKDDFAYTDVSGDGVSQISSVSATTDQNGYTQTVTLTLDGDVQPSDLGSDEVNVRKGALVDRDSNNVKSTAATTVAVKDTFAPDVSAYTFVSAPDVNKNNVGGGYTVTVGVPQGSDHDQVKVTLTDENGNTTSAQNRVGDQKTSVDVSSFDFTKITDGQVDVSVTASDEGGMAGGTKTTSVTKDTVKPSVTSANVDPGEDTVRVTLDDWVSAGVNAFTTNNAPNVDNWQRVSRSASSTTYDVELASDLTVSQFNNGDVTAANVVDDVGNAAQGNPTSFTDDDAPSVQSIDAKNGSKTVTLTFSEPVFNKTDHAKSLSATNFSYNDVANGGAGAITGVSHTAGSDSVTLTLNASVTSADLGNDTVGFSDVVDVADKQVTGRTTLATGVDVQQLSVRASGSTVEVSFNATEELSAIDAGVSAEESIADDDTFGSQQTSWTLSMSDFSEAKMGGLYNYTATVEVPRDGNFQLDSLSVTDLKDNVANLFVGGKSAVVDQSTPEPVSAELKDDAEGDEVVVYFDEPVSSVVNPDTVSLEGDGSVTGADQIGVGAGSVHISVDQTYDTGASPNVTFTDGASAVTEEYGNDDTVADGAKTTVHTDVQVLDASGDGVNFVSVPAAAGELSISDIDAVDANSVEAIWTYDNGQWQSYRPDRSSGNDFTALQGGQGYVFKMKSTTTLAVNVHNVVGGSTRDAATPGARDLEEGWNLVGHWQEGDQPKATALSSVQTNYRTYGQVDGSTGYAYTTVGTFEPGESYWVFVKDDEVYTEAAW